MPVCWRLRTQPEAINMYALAVLILISILGTTYAESVISGSREACINEGESVHVSNIKDISCFSCMCKNGFVECLSESCPSTEGCYLLVEKTKNDCCDRCKGCMYRNTLYPSGADWADPLDPCRVFHCEAGIITESDTQCYTPCDRPLSPKPGQCCPTCAGCRINGQRVTEDKARDVILQEDPCIECRCNGGRLTCSKKACPVLQCPREKQIRLPGECCPKCKGSRILFNVASNCILGTKFLKTGNELSYDRCTHCTCNNETSICKRPSCPVLDCLPEYQKTTPGDCCPHCPQVEEVKTTCTFGGHTRKDGETWQLDPCKSCMCYNGEIRCAMERCPSFNIPCPPNHKLVHTPGQCCPKCVESDGVCTVFGDPHYKTFDGKFFSFQGSCKYQLTADCHEHSFSIRVTNDGRQTKSSAWTKTISIKIKDLKINLGQRKRIKVNGERVQIPFKLDGLVEIDKVDDTILVSTHIGIKVLWDGNSFLEVSAPTKYKNRLCGLCGNYNGKVRDDLITRRGKLLSDNDIRKFGSSWRVGGRKACARLQENPRKEGLCEKIKKWNEQYCLPLKQSNNFGECNGKLNPDKYFKACTMDMCECPTKKCFCEAFTAYAHECQRLGVHLPNWRDLTNCGNNSTTIITSTMAPKRLSRKKKFPNSKIERPKYLSGTRGPPPPLN